MCEKLGQSLSCLAGWGVCPRCNTYALTRWQNRLASPTARDLVEQFRQIEVWSSVCLAQCKPCKGICSISCSVVFMELEKVVNLSRSPHKALQTQVSTEQLLSLSFSPCVSTALRPQACFRCMLFVFRLSLLLLHTHLQKMSTWLRKPRLGAEFTVA